MFTPRSNNETRNVTGLITPCHRPSQNPARCGASTCATLFGPAAQAPRTSAVTTSTATCLVLDFLTRHLHVQRSRAGGKRAGPKVPRRRDLRPPAPARFRTWGLGVGAVRPWGGAVGGAMVAVSGSRR